MKLAQKILDDNLTTYNAIADKFSDTRSRPWPAMEKLTRKYVKDGDEILDVGCGNGRLTQMTNDQFPMTSYMGVDFSEKLIDIAKEKFENNKIKFAVGNVLNLDLGERKFDSVFMFAVLNHIPGEELQLRALQNIRKVLKPGGVLTMTNWNLWRLNFKQKTFWNFKIKRVNGVKDLFTEFKVGEKKNQLYYRAFTLYELKKLAEKSGFKILESYYDYRGQKSWWGSAENLVTVWQK